MTKAVLTLHRATPASLFLLMLLVFPLLLLSIGLEDSTGVCTGVAAFAEEETWSSNLPICAINTGGKEIPWKPAIGSAEKISAILTIIYNKDASGRPLRNKITDTNYHFNGTIKIRHKGRSSSQFPKRAFSIDLEKQSKLMDMPKGDRFDLYPPYADKSLIRNNLAYKLANDIASSSGDTGYSSWWAPRTKYCELFIATTNSTPGEYMGVYVLLERIEQQKERVNIKKLALPKDRSRIDTMDISGGYIWQANWIDPKDITFETNAPYLNKFVVEYPDDKDIVPQFLNYLSGFVSSVETKLYALEPNAIPTFQDVFSIKSFIDYHIFFELTKNVDTYRYSTYFYKDAGGAMYIGPHWDYDLSFGNINYSNTSRDTSGWRTSEGSYVLTWVDVLWRNQWIRNEIAKRYKQLRSPGGALSNHNIFSSIDNFAAELREAQVRNFAKWDILGKYVWPNPEPIPTTYQGEVDALKSWLSKRLEWLDAEMPKLSISN